MFNQDLARGRNPLMQAAEGVGKAIDVAGRAALGLGLLTGAGLIAGHYLGSRPSSDKVVLDDEVSVPPPEGALQTPSAQRRTTSDNYNQDEVANQTDLAQALRGTSPGKPTVVASEEKPATQSQVIANSSTFSPGSELDQLATKDVPHTPVRDRADELIAEFLGGVAAEEKQQEKIQKGLDVYTAGIKGKIERELKPVFKEGRQEGISPIGQGSVRKVEAFRQSPQYAEMMRSAGASMEPAELVGAPGEEEAIITAVRPTAMTQVAVDQPVEVESPIAEMSTPTTEVVVKQPVAVTTPAPTGIEGASPETIALARRTLGHLPLEQAVSLLSGNKGSQIVIAQPAKTRVAAALDPVEFAKGKAASLPEATPRGSAQQALAEAAELYEGQLNPPKGTISGFPAGGSSVIEQARLYPNNMMGIKVKGQGVEYVHKVEPGFVPYAAEMIKSGDFYGKDYNEMRRIGVLQPYIGSEDLPRSGAAYADFISKEKARLGL
jgi:hypothetical protein